MAHSQWLETTIPIPDTFGGLEGAQVLVYDSANNCVYVGGRGTDVMVVDCETNKRVARVPTGPNVVALCCNTRDNKVYSANYDGWSVTVVDAASNRRRKTLPLSYVPTAFCYNSLANKVYCGAESVYVIDGASDSVLATVPAGVWCENSLCYNPQDDKVYAANIEDSSVTVIDGTTNQVLTTIRVGRVPYGLCYNWQNDKVYCPSNYDNTLSVIDGATDSVLAVLAIPGGPKRVCYASGLPPV